MQNPFSPAKVRKAHKAIKDVGTMVKTVMAIKGPFSNDKHRQVRLSAYMPGYRRNKRLLNYQNKISSPISMNHSTDSYQAVSKEVQLRGADFSTEYITADNSPLAESFKKVDTHNTAIHRLHVNHKDSSAVWHQAHTGQIHRDQF
jgi:hypothetical protein